MSKLQKVSGRVPPRRSIPRLQTTSKSTKNVVPAQERGGGVCETEPAAKTAADDGERPRGRTRGGPPLRGPRNGAKGPAHNGPPSQAPAGRPERSRHASKGQLSLQGPFNPNIVRVRNVSESDSKRKRSPSARAASKEGEASELFGNVKSADDFQPKRTQSGLGDKKTYSIEFSKKINTKFGGENKFDYPVKFTAKSAPPSVKGSNKCKTARVGNISKPKDVSGQTGFAGVQKNRKLFQEELQKLEAELEQVTSSNIQQVSGLQIKLKNAKEEVEKLATECERAKPTNETHGCHESLSEKTKDLLSLKYSLQLKLEQCQQKLEDFETDPESLSEKSQDVLSLNQTLQLKLEQCQQKLEDFEIDPVSLKPLKSSKRNQSIEDGNAEAEKKVEKLREKLQMTNNQNKQIIEKLKNIHDALGKDKNEPVETTS